ncbi:NAD(P)-binding protein [Halobacillus sp. Marseille-Q1614]|uniref:NAD(P)-binding protein n=1 Tax=Halobacillus sp. Marseille-Q1614 TaxID=2709134 RepID=UPI00156DE11F|nr:NAD(P)-binding protein [Halobacillus sp. Marseille-Q1614]
MEKEEGGARVRNEKVTYEGVTYPEEMISIIRNGLPRRGRAKHISIIGAGLAGLTAASLLMQAGHHVTILEGNSRIGGRIYTMRQPYIKGR